MPIKTNLESSPYFDDYTENNDYYKVLFKPSVPVQVRELNQLQTMLQAQIERFGDNVFKRGTIVNGCAFTFHDSVPYVKIKDTETDSSPVNIISYNNFLVRNETSNLNAYIIASNTGFETQDPDLNTLYLKYTNSGTSGETIFAANDVLTVYGKQSPVYEVNINNGGSGFSNNDSALFLSALAVQNSLTGTIFTNTSGSACTFSAGQTIIGGTSNARAIIVESNTTANSSAIVLKIRPVYTDLSANPANTARWSFATNELISVTGGVIGATLSESIGTAAEGTIVTDGSGAVTTLTMTNYGLNYYVPPYVNIISTTGSVSSLDITAKNYLAKITVSSAAASVGTGYGFSVSNGVIYQLGYFSRVSEQFIIVEKYSNLPDAKVVGFDTQETIINNNVDQSLLDNALGTFNYTAPGADRLKLNPVLIVLDETDAAANNDFFSIVQFNNGQPFKQNRTTQYETIETELAKRTYEQSGNFVLDKFLVNTVSDETMIGEASNFDIIIDPGKAYISGYRVETQSNYRDTLSKATDTLIRTNVATKVNYGNYIRVKGTAGVFLYSTGDTISLRNTAKTFLSVGANYGAAPSAAGTEIGTARIRSMVWESGVPGSSTAIYRLYLFEVLMNTGKNFKDVKSVFYNGATYKGVADIVLDAGATTTAATIAVLQETANNRLVFNNGATASKVVNALSFTYRTLNQTGLTLGTNGRTALTLSGSEYFPYTAGVNLTTAQKNDILIIPLANLEVSAAMSGTVNIASSCTTINCTSGLFLSTFQAGDYVKLSFDEFGGYDYRRITRITNSTYLTLDSVPSFTNSIATATLAFPRFIPISIASRTGRIANVDVAGTTLNIDLNATLAASGGVAVGYNVTVNNATAITKTANRNLYVRLDCSNTNGNTVGPWCLGVPDVFRLRNVYKGTTNTFISTDSGIEDVTRNFVIDHKQNENSYDLSYLYIKPGTGYTLTSADRLLIKFDAFANNLSNTLFTVSSYTIDDTLVLDSLTTAVNTLEIPEVVDSKNKDIDLRDALDFRPIATNTAVLTTSTTLANIHPAASTRATKYGTTSNPANDQKFPVPDSSITFTVEQYLPRKDLVVISSNGDFSVVKGIPALVPADPKVPNDTLAVELLNIPPFPSLPKNISANINNIINTKVINQRNLVNRKNISTIRNEAELNPTKYSQTPGFTMQQIKSLQDRIETLEYYSTLSLIEDTVRNDTITSANDAKLNRFKFGYFVDNFTSLAYADVDDSEFNAGHNSDRMRLVPAVAQLNLPYKIYSASDSVANEYIHGKALMLPYESVSIVKQLQATGAPNVGTAIPPTYSNGRFYSKIPSTFVAKQNVPIVYQWAATKNLSTITGARSSVAPATSVTPTQTMSSQVFQFIVNGLRPSTRFYFFFDGENKSAQCKPLGGKLAGSLISDKYGVLNFQFFLQYGKASDLVAKELATNKLNEQNAVGKTISGNKSLQLKEGSTSGQVVAIDVLQTTVTFAK